MCKANPEKITHIIDKLEALDKLNKQDLESFVNDYSKYIDKEILNTQKNENLMFLSGKAILKVVDSQNMQFSLDVYYRNISDKYINKKMVGNLMEMDDYLTEQAKSFLISKNEMTFDIEAPRDHKS